MAKKNKIKNCVTGSQGFIASNLVQKLQEDSKNLIEEYNDDISVKFFPNKKPNIIFHLAANTDTTFSDDIEMYRNNIVSFLNVLRYCVDNRVRLVYASSGSVYGNNNFPLNAYGETKLTNDKLAKRYWNKIPIVGLRFMNVYGPREKKKGKMASMITQWREQIKRGERPVIFKGEFKRDFIYVKDVIKSLLIAKKLRSGIYDVGTGIATDFRDVLKIVIKTLGVRIEPKFISNPYLGKYQIFTKADISWGFKPEYTVESGIKDYFENYE